MAKKKYRTYEQSGVSIKANDIMVEKIRSNVLSTYTDRVIDLPNGFAGLFSLENNGKLFKRNYKNPVLVACTDGVGTKVKLAQMAGVYNTVGIDLVAMSVNDMLVQGAEPLFFLDYLAVDKLSPARIAEMVEGVSEGCRQAGCALIGGETAEMPDLYGKDEFDMAGFAVGVVERNKIINGDKVKAGDVILGLASSGLHSNGFTLVRDICFKKLKLKMSSKVKGLDAQTIGESILTPTKIYVQPIIKTLSSYKNKMPIKAMAHITGGGLVGNIPRVLPKNCDAVIDKKSWDKPSIFKFLQKNGPVKESEMFRVFNMGIGFVIVVDKIYADAISNKLTKEGEKVYKIGKIARGTRKVILR